MGHRSSRRELKGRFCAKGFKQVVSRDDKYASTPQATTLKLMLLMSQIHSWEVVVSDVASAFLNTPVDPSKSPIFVQAPQETQASAIWSQRCCLLFSDHGQQWDVQMKSDSCAFLKKD